jgi:hypothetical protein
MDQFMQAMENQSDESQKPSILKQTGEANKLAGLNTLTEAEIKRIFLEAKHCNSQVDGSGRLPYGRIVPFPWSLGDCDKVLPPAIYADWLVYVMLHSLICHIV